MRIHHAIPAKVERVVRHEPANPSPEARRRIRWFDYWRAHGENVSLTCRHFGIARTTFYTWKRRYDPRNLASLEARSSKPGHFRKPTWSLELLQAVLRLREEYLAWGKDKLVVLLHRQDRWKQVSTSMVGRILDHLKRTRQLIEPLRSAISVRKRRHKRAYAVRKPKDYSVKDPGDLVEVDTLDVRPSANVVRKQFTARDLVSRWHVSRWDVLDIRSTASAKTAAQIIDALLERMPLGGRGSLLLRCKQPDELLGVHVPATPIRVPPVLPTSSLQATSTWAATRGSSIRRVQGREGSLSTEWLSWCSLRT